MKQGGASCLGIKLENEVPNEVKLSDVYAVELITKGAIYKSKLPKAGAVLLGFEPYDSEVWSYSHPCECALTLQLVIVCEADTCFYFFGRCIALRCIVFRNQRLSQIFGSWLCTPLVTRICQHVRCGWIELMLFWTWKWEDQRIFWYVV